MTDITCGSENLQEFNNTSDQILKSNGITYKKQ